MKDYGVPVADVAAEQFRPATEGALLVLFADPLRSETERASALLSLLRHAAAHHRPAPAEVRFHLLAQASIRDTASLPLWAGVSRLVLVAFDRQQDAAVLALHWATRAVPSCPILTLFVQSRPASVFAAPAETVLVPESDLPIEHGGWAAIAPGTAGEITESLTRLLQRAPAYLPFPVGSASGCAPDRSRFAAHG